MQKSMRMRNEDIHVTEHFLLLNKYQTVKVKIFETTSTFHNRLHNLAEHFLSKVILFNRPKVKKL